MSRRAALRASCRRVLHMGLFAELCVPRTAVCGRRVAVVLLVGCPQLGGVDLPCTLSATPGLTRNGSRSTRKLAAREGVVKGKSWWSQGLRAPPRPLNRGRRRYLLTGQAMQRARMPKSCSRVAYRTSCCKPSLPAAARAMATGQRCCVDGKKRRAHLSESPLADLTDSLEVTGPHRPQRSHCVSVDVAGKLQVCDR